MVWWLFNLASQPKESAAEAARKQRAELENYKARAEYLGQVLAEDLEEMNISLLNMRPDLNKLFPISGNETVRMLTKLGFHSADDERYCLAARQFAIILEKDAREKVEAIERELLPLPAVDLKLSRTFESVSSHDLAELSSCRNRIRPIENMQNTLKAMSLAESNACLLEIRPEMNKIYNLLDWDRQKYLTNLGFWRNDPEFYCFAATRGIELFKVKTQEDMAKLECKMNKKAGEVLTEAEDWYRELGHGDYLRDMRLLPN